MFRGLVGEGGTNLVYRCEKRKVKIIQKYVQEIF